MARSNNAVFGSFVFAVIIASILGLLVSATANLLAPRIASNRELERKTHVLITTRFLEPTERPGRAAIEQLYAKHIDETVLPGDDQERPLFLGVDNSGTLTAVCIPLAGGGLWGPIKGYLALDASAQHILRITFYEHRETPGLGAEISSLRWTSQWSGKSIIDQAGHLAEIRVKKGNVNPHVPDELAHAVDGISGATISGNAVAALVNNGLSDYSSYLEGRWKAN